MQNNLYDINKYIIIVVLERKVKIAFSKENATDSMFLSSF